MGAPTISQVAKEAGISVATVSRVINQKGAVTPETARKVQQAIERLGYQPNVWGRNLRRGESRVVLVMVPNVTNPYYAPIIAGTEDTLSAAGYSIVLCITNMDRNRREHYADFMRNRRADGAILMDVAMDDRDMVQLAEEYPLVQCCEYCDRKDISHVSIDNFSAAREAVSRLAALGHTRIGYIGAKNNFISTALRHQGYHSALEELSIGLRPDYEESAGRDYSFSTGVEAAGRLLDRVERPTALFCVSDVLALGAVQAARERGLRIPEDLSIVGFDDVEYASMFQPRLTTIRQPCYRMGAVAASLLLRQMQGERGGQEMFLPHEWVARDSTAGWPMNHTSDSGKEFIRRKKE